MGQESGKCDENGGGDKFRSLVGTGGNVGEEFFWIKQHRQSKVLACVRCKALRCAWRPWCSGLCP